MKRTIVSTSEFGVDASFSVQGQQEEEPAKDTITDPTKKRREPKGDGQSDA